MADNIRYLIPPNRIRNLRRKALDLARSHCPARDKPTLDRADFILDRIAVTLFAKGR